MTERWSAETTLLIVGVSLLTSTGLLALTAGEVEMFKFALGVYGAVAGAWVTKEAAGGKLGSRLGAVLLTLADEVAFLSLVFTWWIGLLGFSLTALGLVLMGRYL